MSDSIKHQVLHSLKWVTLGKITSQLVRWAITFWVIRLLMAEDYGVVSLADLFFGFITLVLSPLIGPSIIQHRDISKQQLKQLFGVVVLAYLSAFVIQMLIADSVGAFYQSENVAKILKVNAWCLPIILFSVIPNALLAKELQFKYVSVVAAFSNIVAAVSTLIMAYLGYGFWALIYGEIIAISIGAILVFIRKPVIFLPDFKIDQIKSFLRFGGMATLNSILFYIFLFMDVAIAGRYMSIAEVGLYAIGLQIALMPQKKILPLIKQVAFPAFSSIQDQPERIASYTVKAQKLTFYMTVPIFWGIAAVIDLIIPIIVGESWEAAIMPTKILLIIMPLKFSQELFGPALSSQRKLKHLCINVCILISVMIPAILVGVNFGAVGLASAWVLGFPVAFSIVFYRNCKELKISISKLIKLVFMPTIAGLFMLGAVYVSKLFLSEVSVESLLLQVTIGASIYALLIWIFDKAFVKEILALAGKKKP